jgi:hypothetical protein
MVQLMYGAMAYAEFGDKANALVAARLVGASETLRPVDYPPLSVEREVRERAVTAVVALLGDAAYERAYAEGGGLSLEEATALV